MHQIATPIWGLKGRGLYYWFKKNFTNNYNKVTSNKYIASLVNQQLKTVQLLQLKL